MLNHNPGCFGHYNFDHITNYAKKRFIDNDSTINLLKQAHSETEREEIALVCMLDVADEIVLDIQLDCRYSDDCKVTNCRDKLRKLIEAELVYKHHFSEDDDVMQYTDESKLKRL